MYVYKLVKLFSVIAIDKFNCKIIQQNFEFELENC